MGVSHERPQAALPPSPEGDEQSGQATFAHEASLGDLAPGVWQLNPFIPRGVGY